MEILFVSHKYPPSIGGMEKQSFELISRMDKLTKVHKLTYSGQESKVLFFIKLRYRIRKIFKKYPSISIVHFNDGVMAFFGLYLSKVKNLNVTTTVHGLDVVFPNVLYQKWFLPRFNRLDKVICVSKFTAEACIDRGIHRSKVVVINNGVDHSISNIVVDDDVRSDLNFQLDDCTDGLIKNKKIIMSLGRAVKRKGFSWFAENIVPKLPGCYLFVMVGPMKYRKGFSNFIFNRLHMSIQNQINLFSGWPTDSESISRIINDEKFKGKVCHLGKVSYEKLIALFDITELFVMPNIKVEGDAEGFGLVALEASLRSKYVLASNLEGIKDAIVDNENGKLVEPLNAEQWVRNIKRLSSEPYKLKEKGSAGKDFTLSNYGWEKMVSQYFQLFESLMP